MKALYGSIGLLIVLGGAVALGAGCEGDGDVVSRMPSDLGQYVVFGWNDLGMHCLNPTYDSAVILPPYNNVLAQVVKRGNPPQVVSEGVELSYRMVDNTHSMGKKDEFGGDFSSFWQHDEQLFGTDLPADKGLNLSDPSIHNGLSGKMVKSGDHFTAEGIPLTPVKDDGTWTPYQVVEITAKSKDGAVLATTRATVPTSDEINCAKCHGAGKSATGSIGGGLSNTFDNILKTHDVMHGTQLEKSKPVLCASCHPSPALGGTASNPANYLSARIHGSHASRGATCQDCHPGPKTQCNRSLAHTAPGGNCTTCHGPMSQVASSIINDKRVPWVNEPTCVQCHKGVHEVDTGDKLYRNARGHGGMYCTACHGSPHAMVPSREASDNAQAVRMQGAAKSIGSCGSCHSSSRGAGAGEFAEKHAGSNPRHVSACNVCHTATPGNLGGAPHGYTWKNHGGI